MNLSSPPPAGSQFEAQVHAPMMTGAAKVMVNAEALAVVGLLDAAEIGYADMTAIELRDYAVTVKTPGGNWVFSRMGQGCQPFHDALLACYNDAVLEALFAAGTPLVTANGAYDALELGLRRGGHAPVRLYENCLCLLPPDVGARRVPLCFVSGMEAKDYALRLTLSSGEQYTMEKMGYDFAPMAAGVEGQLRALGEQTLRAVKALDPSLTPTQAAGITRLMRAGTAAPMGVLAGIAPSFVPALEAKLADSRARESYRALVEMCGRDALWIGFKENTSRAAGEADDPCMLWLMAPAPAGGACAVEFAGEAEDAAATFVYRFEGDFEAFARQLNRALEAIDFRREVIRLSEGELLRPENARYRMAVQRNSALGLVRARLLGRVIHNGGWQQRLLELWAVAASQAEAAPQIEAEPPRFCSGCGAKLGEGARFCGKCGHPV